ncbi:hypothetical protein [Paenibacillus sp. sgz500958]|uniref:hypothetical protein n=1 Tax=Paenibacillus sp. sgz500958 TaxID=3242475 RepID=UPI0036D22171
MLDDTSRKLLRIMYHFSRSFRRMPDLVELGRLSSRMPAPIKKGMRQLAEQNYILWNPEMPVETAVIIEGWERNSPVDKHVERKSQLPQKSAEPGALDYWQYY